MRDCLIKTGVATGVSACVTGLGAASSATGAAIMESAGWTANGVAIVATEKVAAAGAAGFATLFVPIIAVVAATAALNELDPKTATTTATGSTIACAALAGVIGAAELNLKGIELGYIVASTAAGTPVIETGLGLLACMTMCGAAFCKQSSSNTNNRTAFFHEPTAPFPRVMGDAERSQPRA